MTRLDQLARSTRDLFAIVKRIVHVKAQFRSVAEPWADTGTSTGRLMIAVLGGLIIPDCRFAHETLVVIQLILHKPRGTTP